MFYDNVINNVHRDFCGMGLNFSPCNYLPAQNHGFSFLATEKEKTAKLFHLKYSAAENNYIRVSNDNEIIHNWEKGVWKMNSVLRKVEQDWKMVWLYVHCFLKG